MYLNESRIFESLRLWLAAFYCDFADDIHDFLNMSIRVNGPDKLFRNGSH